MRILCVTILLLCISCASVEKEVIYKDISPTIKIDLVFEKEIKGEYFGIPLNQPYGLAVDFQGNIFVADAGNSRILKFDSNFRFLKQIGGFGTDDGLFNFPTFISFDNGLNLMVSDEKNQRITRYNAQLQYVDEIQFFDEEDPLKFGFPSGITFTNYGEIWVADRDNNQIAIFNNIGKYSHSLGQFGYSGGQLSSPEKIVRDSDGDFFVCDAGNRRVVRYDEYGNHLKDYKVDRFEYPSSLFIQKDKLFILDANSGEIYYFEKSGRFIASIDAKLLGDRTALVNPSDLLFISKDKILISDTGNDRLVVGKLIIEE